jgi:2-phospho-L-lactate guanylyltransferase
LAVTCIVPAKRLENAKRRLSGILTAAERAALVSAMLVDVLSAANAVPGLSVEVVTADAALAGLAREHGAGVEHDAVEDGYNSVVSRTSMRLARRGVEAILVLPADVPLVTPGDIAALIAPRPSPWMRVVQASSDGGTNGLAMSPPDALPILFGPDSFRQHLRAARDLGIANEALTLPGLALDIDRPADLVALAASGQPTRAGRLVASWNFCAGMRGRSRPHLSAGRSVLSMRLDGAPT